MAVNCMQQLRRDEQEKPNDLLILEKPTSVKKGDQQRRMTKEGGMLLKMSKERRHSTRIISLKTTS